MGVRTDEFATGFIVYAKTPNDLPIVETCRRFQRGEGFSKRREKEMMEVLQAANDYAAKLGKKLIKDKTKATIAITPTFEMQ